MIVSKIVNLLYRVACKLSTETWFLNTDDYQKFIDNKIINTHSTVRILPSEGINTSKFRALYKKRKTPITRFLFAGRLLGQKGIVHFVEAAKQIKRLNKNVRFEILGFIDPKNPDSVSYTQIKNWQNLGIIKYLGSTEDVRPFIDRADCVILPSFYKEGISRVLLEAASMSTPLITTDNTGCKELVINNITGFICAKKSTSSLILAIQKFLDLDSIERLKMGQNGRDYIKTQFDINKIISIYYRSLDSISQIDSVNRASNNVMISSKD